ncbi:MAG: hypothetical protein BA869_02005 [Desulfuromonadales bacterium C00003107]|nr:MAG: hypothetical protein BA869_02005 [Desulfuromonadales bacterium C00003107]
MSIEIVWLLIGVALVAGAVIGTVLRSRISGSQVAAAKQSASQILAEAGKEADILRKEAAIQAKDALLGAKTEWESEAKEMRRELQAQEKRLLQREENLDRKLTQLEEREDDLGRREKHFGGLEDRLKQRESEIDKLIAEQRARLESISGLSAEEARQQLMANMESQARHDCAKGIKQIEDEARETADKKAKEILALAIQRYAGDYVAERAVSVVPLPSDDPRGGNHLRVQSGAARGGTDLSGASDR